MDSHDITNIERPRRGIIPPWKLKPINIDEELHSELNKKEAPIPLLALANLKIHNYKDSTAIYTDASKTTDGRVGVGVFINDPDHNLADSLSLRISDNTSVFTGEMTAIKIALAKIEAISKETEIKNFTIYTDSLSSTQAISSRSCFAQPNLLIDILEMATSINAIINIVWVPSHIGISGNETADSLAYLATQKPDIDINIPKTIVDFKPITNSYIDNIWQERWDNSPTGRHLHDISPTIHPPQLKFTNRRTERLAHRLRLGACALNSQLHKLNCHATGKCDICQEEETIHHFLIGCQTELTEELKGLCQKMDVEHNLKSMLASSRIITQIGRQLERIALKIAKLRH